MDSAQLNRTRLSMGLKHAVEDDELRMEYQPICDLTTHRIVAAEALLRWTPRGQVTIAPSEFIPVAEDTGLIKLIGEWALRHALRDAASWYAAHHVAVTVNVSHRQLDDADFGDMVVAGLRKFGLPSEALVIEVTETGLMTTSPSSIDHLRRLHERGIRVAIDDFGTGYSSLASVARLPVDIVKIDKSFIQQPGQRDGEHADWNLVRAVIQMVEPLHLQTLAEGVETTQQADKLRELRCHLGQGFLIGKPMPAKQLTDRLPNAHVADPPGDAGSA